MAKPFYAQTQGPLVLYRKATFPKHPLLNSFSVYNSDDSLTCFISVDGGFRSFGNLDRPVYAYTGKIEYYICLKDY